MKKLLMTTFFLLLSPFTLAAYNLSTMADADVKAVLTCETSDNYAFMVIKLQNATETRKLYMQLSRSDAGERSNGQNIYGTMLSMIVSKNTEGLVTAYYENRSKTICGHTITNHLRGIDIGDF